MSATQKWIDLRGGGEGSFLKIGTFDQDDGRQIKVLYITGLRHDSLRWQRAIDLLGFIPSPGKKYLVRKVREKESVRAADFHPVWPNAVLKEMPRDQILIDVRPIRQLRQTQAPRTEEERDISVEAGMVVRLGRNAEGEEVFSGPMGRYLQRETGQKVYETDLLGPALFLRATDEETLNICADGFVQAMLHGEVQHSDDLDRFILALFDREGPYSEETYTRVATAVDAAMVRTLNRSYDTAQDAFGDAARLYDYLPPYKGSAKGEGAMPLPLSVIGQRLLGDTSGKIVLVPNAWDGASFAFLSAGTRIHAFRGDKDLSGLVTNVRADDVTWAERFDPAREQGADGLFFNADPQRDGAGQRRDFVQALSALRTLNPGARAVLVLAGDDRHAPGVIADDSFEFIRALGRRYDIETVVEVGAELTGRLGTGVPIRVFAVRNQPAGEHSFQGESIPVLHSWDELKSAVDEAIASANVREAESEAIDLERAAAGNDFQRPYVSFSKVGEARTMVPLNLQGPLQFALSNLERVYGPVDRFVEAELGFGPNTLGERFSPEQVDAIGLGLARMKHGRGIIIGDETGIGKGRTLSGYATWANKQGHDVILVTDRANLFSDLVRDLRDIGEWGRFRPLIVNADGRLVDVFTGDLIQEGTPVKTMNNIMEQGTSLAQLQCNMIFVTYSQVSGEDSPKADWLLSQSDNALVVVDEAHVAAGSNSNTSSVVSELVNRAWAVAYSSATWAKSSENLHVYSRAFPETINVASLAQTMRTGGEAFSEVFSSMLARDGAFIRREHDLSKIEFSFEVDAKRQARNEALSDQVSGVLAAMTYVGGEINRLLIRMNSDTMKRLKGARDNRTAAVAAANEIRRETQLAVAHTGDEPVPVAPQVVRGTIMRSSFGAGSVLYQVMRRFLTVLNADQVTELALEAARQNRKPVIVFEDTGEAFLKRIIAEEIIPGIDGEKDILPESVRAPNIKDLLRNVMKRLGVITLTEVDEEYLDTPAQQRDLGEDNIDDAVDLDAVVNEQDEAIRAGRRLGVSQLPGLSPEAQEKYEEGIDEIMKMIDALPPLPLNTVDVITARLEDAGLRVGEISGRGMRLQPAPEDRLIAIDDSGWESTKLRIVPRSKKKVDVNSTVLGFNNGDLDAVVINGAAATGLSLHASPRFGDVRRRELIELQIQEDPTKRIQLFGRVNRYDQVVTPRMSIPTTGIYGEVRQVMMQNMKLARLSANIRSSRENAAEIKTIPNLLNPVGQEVARRFLEENGGIRNRLGISEVEVEKRPDIASLLTSRVALLFVREQRMVYEELQAMFEDTLLRYELQGENPLKPKEKDLRAKVVSSSIVVGIEMEGLGSAFDGPVYLRELEWKESKKPLGWRQMLEVVRQGRERMIADGLLVQTGEVAEPGEVYEPPGFTVVNGVPMDARGNLPTGIVSGVDLMGSNLFHMGDEEDVDESLMTPVSRVEAVVPVESTQGRRSWMSAIDSYSKDELKDIENTERALPPVEFSDLVEKLGRILDAKVQIELAGSTFADVDAALQSNGPNGIKRAQARALWVRKYMPRMVPGCAVGLPISSFTESTRRELGDMAYEWGVVCAIKAPPKGREAMLSRWKVDVLTPGSAAPMSLSLSTFMDKADLVNTESGVTSRTLIDGSPILEPHETLATQELTLRTMRREHLMSRFRRESRRSTVRRGQVMEGNLYLASEWAASTKMGSGVVYTDERGVRHRAIWINERYANQIDGETMPVRLWSQKMIQRFMERLIRPTDQGGCDPNGPGNTYLIPTNFQAAMPGGLHSDAGTRVMIVPGQAIALVVNKGDLGRMLRALRGHQKSWLRRNHPDFKTYSDERKSEVNAQLVKISSSTRKRGERPVIFLACEQVADFEKATELLCAAAGIELYLPRRTQAGVLAAQVQAELFAERRDMARDALGDRSADQGDRLLAVEQTQEIQPIHAQLVVAPARNDEGGEDAGRMRVAT